MTEEKMHPCEYCKFGTYITAKGMWWCGKHKMYVRDAKGNVGFPCPCKLFQDQILGECLLTH